MRKIYVVFIVGYLFPVALGTDDVDMSLVCLEAPFCVCRFVGGYRYVFCSRVMVFQPVYNLILSHRSRYAIFLNHCGLTTLPSHAFENVSVFEFTSYCPLSDIPDDAFDGAEEFRGIALVYTTFTTIPYSLQNLSSLRTLTFRNHRLTSLNHELWNLPLLTKVSFKSGTLEELAEDVFARTPYIGDLNLSHNRLKYLHPNILKPLMILRKIHLNGNYILTVDGFPDNINLEAIDLSDNNLTTVDYFFRIPMVRLKTLMISRNPISSFAFLSADVVTFPNLQIFEMEAVNCREIDPTFFEVIPLLQEVNLGLNGLQNISKTLFQRHLQLAVLNDNAITSIKGLFENSPQLFAIILSNNRIFDISQSFQNLKNLRLVGLGGNDIKRVSNGNFEGLEQMNFLNLSFNNIELIEAKSFRGLKNLHFLFLSGNCFKNLNGSLQNLPLVELFADSACLDNINSEDFSGLTKLTNLSLSNNNITSVDGAFRDLESLLFLNISGNKLTTLSRDTFPKNLKLKMLWLATGNQLHCDCRLAWLIEYQAQMDHSVLQDSPVCHLPLRLRGKPIKELTVKTVAQWSEGCPVSCRCRCVSLGTTFYVGADCSYRNLIRVPDVFPKEMRDLDLSDNELESLNSLSNDTEENLIALNLENNKMTTLASIPQNLISFRIAGNLFNRFQWSLLPTESLEMLTLANNPWICDCETVDFRRWLLSMGDIVVDVNDTKCGPSGHQNLYGKVIIDLTDTDLCPSSIFLYVSLALGLLGTILLASLLVLIFTRYRLYIKAWLYANGQTWVKENETQEEKLFDAFLSYHEDDEEFVFSDIVPILENSEPEFTVCIPNRDIVCGMFSVLAHLEAMRDSRRIIVILTQKYINDVSCMSIFQQAYQQSLEDKVHRVILIEVEHIRMSEDMNPQLVTILESNNCIPWQGSLFLERLYYAMPKKMHKTVHNETHGGIELA